MAGPELQPIDLLLGQGSAEQLAAMRTAVAEDPRLTIEVAETVALLEQLRTVRTEPSPAAAAKFADVVRRAERRLQPAPTTTWRTWLFAAAAAGATFALLAWADPLRLRRAGVPAREAAEVPSRAARPAEPGAPLVVQSEPVRTPADVEWSESLQAMRQRLAAEAASQLTAALDETMRRDRDPLASWLHPRNALAVLRLDHELRARADVRLRALLDAGGGALADERAQRLADTVADELRTVLPVRPPFAAPALADVAHAVRALIAVGAGTLPRAEAVERGAAWLAAHLPGASDETLVVALAALVEVAAVRGSHVPEVIAAGERLVDEVLHADDETWRRRRPALLGPRVAAAVLGDAGQLLALLPGFGLSGERCALVRCLVLGELRERAAAANGPEVLAAVVFGCGDLLDDVEHAASVRQLRRWKPARLAPDFATVQQIAWGIEPGQLGFTRLQGDLRQLAVLPEPPGLGARGLLCMSLAANYAARRSSSLQRFALGE